MNNSNHPGRARQGQARQTRAYTTNRISNNQANHRSQAQMQQSGMQASMPLLDSLFQMDDSTAECVIEEVKLPSQVYSNRSAPSTSRNTPHTQLIPARPQTQRQAPRGAHQELAIMPPKPSGVAGGNRRYPLPTSMALATITSSAPQQAVNVINQYVHTMSNRGQPCATMAINPGTLRPHDITHNAVPVQQQQQLVAISNLHGSGDLPQNAVYHIVFHDLVREHKDLLFTLPKHFYEYFQADAQPTKMLLFKYNQRALAMEVEMSIFSDFVSLLLHFLVITWRVQYHMEIQDAPQDWIARYKKGAVVNYTNYERLAKRVAGAINCNEPPLVIDEKLPEPISIYITAQKNYLSIVLTWKEEGKEKLCVHDGTASVGTQTNFLVLPSYYMDMLRDQIAAMTISEIKSDEGFFEHQEVITAMETSQKNILGHVGGICEKFDSIRKMQKDMLDGSDTNDELLRQCSISKELQTEGSLMADGQIMQRNELPPADAIFDVYEDHLQKILEYSVSNYKKCLSHFQEREAEYKQLKYELNKKEHSHRDPKKSDKYDAKHRDDKKVYGRKDKDEKKSPSCSNKEGKENRDVKDDWKRSESRSRTNSYRKRLDSGRKSEKNGCSVNEKFLDTATYLEGLKAILNEHNFANNVPAEAVKQELPPDEDKNDSTADAFEQYLNEINAEPIKFEVDNGVMGQAYSLGQNTDFLSEYTMCLS